MDRADSGRCASATAATGAAAAGAGVAAAGVGAAAAVPVAAAAVPAWGLPDDPAGAYLRMRKRWVPTSAPPTRTSVRVVTKYPAPSLVVLRDETDSITVSKATSSPGRSGRAYSCSQSVATTAVQPAPSSRDSSSS